METETAGERGEPPLDLASVGSRFIGYLIDSVIVGVIGSILSYASMNVGETLGGINAFLGFLVSVGYYTYFFGNGQTPGMMAMKIKLVGTDGTYPIGYGKGFLRWIGMGISTAVILLGYLWILIDKKKQGWHDKIAGTYVVNA
ncbi:RDD family protein [Methanothrix harundinacea]|uniref:RDD domain containing protein n=1 Tax=Methanothrix harundinacea (strain 6Ac) TaxID=1110509 RepID=G7WNJ2_METH6|nr:RDD family protein [Methanothrix harundinacea]AET63968.1 RDD domain containing protein [Methanothrix harundinacea 6Ac]